MIESILSLLSSFIISTIGAMGYAGIVLLMAIESACIPLPSEIILPFSGYLILSGRFNLWGVALAGALGCNLGSLVAYYAGAYGGRSFLIRYGKYLLVSRRDMDMADRWFERYGPWTVFFARLLPVIRTFIALPAGIVRMNVWKFHLYTFLGSFPWCLALAYAGYQLGVHWDALRPYFHKFDFLIGGLLVAGAAAYLWHHLRNGSAEETSALSAPRPPSKS
jgi:membrane protein DedA with SNARE-associated domain